jgi:hypothetical protein
MLILWAGRASGHDPDIDRRAAVAVGGRSGDLVRRSSIQGFRAIKETGTFAIGATTRIRIRHTTIIRLPVANFEIGTTDDISPTLK